MRGIHRDGLPPRIIHGHEVSGDHGVHRARGDDASRGRVHDRVPGDDDARSAARVIHVGVAQVDPSGVERAARVRVHVVPGDGHIVDGAVRRDADDPFEVRIHGDVRSEEHTSELQSLTNLVCRLLLEKKKKKTTRNRLKKKSQKDITRDSKRTKERKQNETTKSMTRRTKNVQLPKYSCNTRSWTMTLY